MIFVLAQLQQAAAEYKLRPVLLLKQFLPFGDWLVCGISSQTRHQVPDFDELIYESDDDFSSSGLHASLIVIIGFLATLPAKDLPATIGEISQNRHQRILSRLITFWLYAYLYGVTLNVLQ